MTKTFEELLRSILLGKGIDSKYPELSEPKVQKILSLLSSTLKEVVGEEEKENKHDRCTLDDNYCYDHAEIMEDNELPNGAYHRNQKRQEIVTALKEKGINVQ